MDLISCAALLGFLAFQKNVQLAITPRSFIRETQAYSRATPDQSGIASLIGKQKEHQGDCPPKLIYDQAGGTAKTRAEVQSISGGQTQLVAQLLAFEKRTEQYGPYDFSRSADGKALTCPGSKTAQVGEVAHNRDGRSFRFYAFQCWRGEPPRHMNAGDLSKRCPLWEKCRCPKQGPGARRKVFISDYRNEVLAAQPYNQSAAFEEEMRLRPRVERVVFELTNSNGARHCRQRGLLKADWQAKMCATAYNVKRWMRGLPV